MHCSLLGYVCCYCCRYATVAAAAAAAAAVAVNNALVTAGLFALKLEIKKIH